MKCKTCAKNLPKGRRIFCSTKCERRDYYLRNKEKIKKSSREWAINNPERHRELSLKAHRKFREEHRERFNELILRSYRKNKHKWNSRKQLYQLIYRNKKKMEIEKKCKRCGSEEDLRFKFEAYPVKVDDIRKAIKEEKIYYLCSECRKKKGFLK